MNEKDVAWQAAAAAAQNNPPPITSSPPHRATVKRPTPTAKNISDTIPREDDGALTDALLLTTPTLVGLTIFGIIESSALMDSPGIWVVLLAALAIAITTMAAALETSRADGDAAHIVWPMLLIWPIAYALHMATRDKLGQTARLLSGLVGAVVLTAASGLALKQIHDARSNLTGRLDKVQQMFQPSDEALRAQAEREARFQKLLEDTEPR